MRPVAAAYPRASLIAPSGPCSSSSPPRQAPPEQRLLAREVVGERATADSGAGLHRLDRRAVVAVLGEQPGRDLDHVRPGGPAPLDVLVHPSPIQLTDRLSVCKS